MWNLTVWPILDYSIKNWASDIHITEWEAVWFRIHWKLWKLEWAWKIDKLKVRQILLELMNDNKEEAKAFMEHKDADFSYVHTDWTPFRCNAFYKLNKMAFVLRRIASQAVPMEKLWLPEGAHKFTKAKQWLILVTWPTWSGKSTSMISILDEINKTRREHILTLEDPVEFIFTDNKSIFSQRHIGHDSKSFHNALRAAMREDPDIVVVWEMRDKETVEAAMELAETWHLVVSTLHTSWSVATLTRLVNFFPPDLQHAVRYKLGDILFWVLSQRLVPKAEGEWREWIFEIMFMTSWIKNLIRSWDLVQINNAIEMWQSEWMITMKNYADRKAQLWLIKEEDYINYFVEDM